MRWSKLRWNGYAVCVFVLLLGACSQATAAPTSAPATAAPAADTAQPTAAPTSAPTAAPTSAPLSGEVSFLTFGSPAQAAAYQALAAAFEARYLGTKVNIISLADNEEDYHAKLSTELAGGQPPEVVLLDYDAAARYFAAGAFQSLSGDLAQSTLIHPTDFYTPATSSYQWQGQQMCLPVAGAADVPAPERLQRGGVLQQEAVRRGRPGLPQGRLDLGPVHRHRQSAHPAARPVWRGHGPRAKQRAALHLAERRRALQPRPQATDTGHVGRHRGHPVVGRLAGERPRGRQRRPGAIAGQRRPLSEWPAGHVPR